MPRSSPKLFLPISARSLEVIFGREALVEVELYAILCQVLLFRENNSSHLLFCVHLAFPVHLIAIFGGLFVGIALSPAVLIKLNGVHFVKNTLM